MGAEQRIQPRIVSGVSVRLRSGSKDGSRTRTLHNVSIGGIACYSDEPVRSGDTVTVGIGIGGQEVQLRASVVWCRASGGRYQLGLRFDDHPLDERERLCGELAEIERYRHEVLTLEGRQLSSDEAAREWASDRGATVQPEED